MYLFGTVAYAGMALLQTKLWSLALLPVVFAVTHCGVVLKEEEFLDHQFAEAYARYKAKVRRWV